MAKETEQQRLQEEPVAQPDELQQLITFARVHGLPVALGLLIAVAIIAIVSMHRRRTQLTMDSASTMLGKAMQVQDLNSKSRQLDDVLQQYPSTPSAPLALMALAKAHFDEEQHDIAINKYVEFKSRYPEHPHAVAAELGRVHCLEALNSKEEALSGFDAFLEQYGDHYLAPQAGLGKARCLMSLGRTNEARQVCEELIVARPKTAWSAKAEMLIERSKRKPRPVMRPTMVPPVDLYDPGVGSFGAPPMMPPISLEPPVAPPVPEKSEAPEADAAEDDAAEKDGAKGVPSADVSAGGDPQ